MRRRNKTMCILWVCAGTLIFLLRLNAIAATSEITSDPTLVEATAYYNPRNNDCADGTKPIAGLTCAAKKSWIGKTIVIYEYLDNGMIGEIRHILEIHDTGFGNDLDGDGIGSIQEGKCIDIYFNTYEECKQFGRQKVYIQLFDAEG